MCNRIELDTTEVAELPPGGNEFLDALQSHLDSRYVQSILFFGSTVTGDISESSDIDLIIVLSDQVPNSYRDSIEWILSELANEHLETETIPSNRFEWLIQQATGMFQSGFVSTAEDIKRGRFHAIFNTSVFVYYLAPWRTVMAGVFEGVISVYQDPVSPNWEDIEHPLDHSLDEMCKSLLMTFTLSCFQIVYSVITSRGSIYAQESYKWAVYTIAYHVQKSTHSLDEALYVVPNLFGFHDQFQKFRSEPQSALKYQLMVPPIIILLHLWGLQYVIRNKSSEVDKE